MQYFYDQAKSELILQDLQSPSVRRGVAIGSIQGSKASRKPVAVMTSDGGAHWDVVKLEEVPVSLFFLNDSLGWMVTEKGIWKTDEAGKDWKKLPKPPATPWRVYFADENNGWAACNKKMVLVTHDGGHKWEPVHVATDPPGAPIAEYSDWIIEHKQQVPNWFPVDTAREAFAATYPLHPSVLSVFERKWQTLPRFQRTRGILRLLALWVARAYQEGFQGAHKDPLIGLGTAPLDDPMFRSALFEQLGENKLEGAVTTDICGKKDSHAIRLDAEAVDTIRKARLNRKVATSIFFESNGGQARAEATIPEIRLAVAEPSLDIGNVETVVDALENACYFLSVDRNRYRFGLSANLNKLLADKRASIQQPRIEDRVRVEVQSVFSQGLPIDRIYFPAKSSQIPNRAALTIEIGRAHV